MKTLNIAALQLATLGIQSSSLEGFLLNALKKDVKLVLLGEYVLNHFFKEMMQMNIEIIKKQTKQHIDYLIHFANEHNIVIVTPIVEIQKNKYIKSIAKIDNKGVKYFPQQILISYKHWNEESFFDNPIAPLREPLTFALNGFKVAVFSGFELHFSYFWDYVRSKNITLVLLPTSSTFASHNRWREIIKTQAYLTGCYVLRANRLGEYVEDDYIWDFYGDSMLVSPNGEVVTMLENRESMIIETIELSEVNTHRKNWGFQKALEKRSL